MINLRSAAAAAVSAASPRFPACAPEQVARAQRGAPGEAEVEAGVPGRQRVRARVAQRVVHVRVTGRQEGRERALQLDVVAVALPALRPQARRSLEHEVALTR